MKLFPLISHDQDIGCVRWTEMDLIPSNPCILFSTLSMFCLVSSPNPLPKVKWVGEPEYVLSRSLLFKWDEAWWWWWWWWSQRLRLPSWTGGMMDETEEQVWRRISLVSPEFQLFRWSAQNIQQFWSSYFSAVRMVLKISAPSLFYVF